MGKRRVRSEKSEIQTLNGGDDYDEITRVEEKEKGGFFACYLLTSLSPRHKGHTYIGFTVNPRRRIRQHNGEMRCGAWRTKTKRPWEMVLCIYGFPTNVSALQFEWAWQHPTESLAVRKAAATFKSLSGIASKIKLAYTMLNLPAWQSLTLTVNFFSTKYTKHYGGCPSLPEHMNVQVCSMDDLPCYTGSDLNTYENEDEWCDDKECEKTVSVCQSIELTKNNFTDHQKSIEETVLGENEWVEDIGKRRSRDMPVPEVDYGQPAQVLSSFVASANGALETVEERVEVDWLTRKHSPSITAANEDQLPVLSSFVTSNSRQLETVEDREMFELNEESRVELHRLSRNHSPAINAAKKDQEPTLVHEVDIIDVLSPSPAYRGKKKRRVSTVCPDIIDLTNSPIFV